MKIKENLGRLMETKIGQLHLLLVTPATSQDIFQGIVPIDPYHPNHYSRNPKMKRGRKTKNLLESRATLQQAIPKSPIYYGIERVLLL